MMTWMIFQLATSISTNARNAENSKRLSSKEMLYHYNKDKGYNLFDIHLKCNETERNEMFSDFGEHVISAEVLDQEIKVTMRFGTTSETPDDDLSKFRSALESGSLQFELDVMDISGNIKEKIILIDTSLCRFEELSKFEKREMMKFRGNGGDAELGLSFTEMSTIDLMLTFSGFRF